MTEDRLMSPNPAGQNTAKADATERLLQLAGRRPAVPAARAARVRANVHDAWHTELRRRRSRRLLLSVSGLAATAAVATFVVFVAKPQPAVTPAAVVATIDRAEGAGALRAGTPVRAGEWITTSGAARVALGTPSGTSIRLDEHSRMRLVSESAIELTAGAVYLDTAPGAPPVEVRTSLGNITDIGTQFEVRFIADALRVRVRTGVVAVKRARTSIQVEADTELTLTSRGAESRAMPLFGTDWKWAAALAPPFAIEGQRLAAFLEYLARENGWTLGYEDRALERAAADVVLHGSVEGLDAEAALDVVSTIADLSYTLERGELYVFRGRTQK